MRTLLLDLAALVWPTQCVACGSADRVCCDDCRRQVLESDRAYTLPLSLSVGWCTVYAAGEYDDPVRALLVALKHAGATGCARLLGARLAHPLQRCLSAVHAADSTDSQLGTPINPLRADRQTLFIVTAPSRASRVRERGYRHLDLMLRAALRRVRDASLGRSPPLRDSRFAPSAPPSRVSRFAPPEPPPVSAQLRFISGALRATRGRTGQVGLTVAERRSNAERIAVSARAAALLRGRRVLLVDDIVTTGATVTAAAEALAAVGAEVVGVVALCLVRRRDAEDDETHKLLSRD